MVHFKRANYLKNLEESHFILCAILIHQLMEIKTLNSTPIEMIVDAFNNAFADYSISIQFTPETKKQRLKKARSNLDYSVGVFDDGKLVAFILTGVGQKNGLKTTYNGGTGVIPSHRGQRLVKQMYDFITPIWKRNGFTQTTLEVIVDNDIAIKAYESVGMSKIRRLISYHGPLPKGSLPSSLHFTTSTSFSWDKYKPLHSFDYAWDFCRDGVEAISEEYLSYELHNEHNQLLAFAIIHKKGQIAQAGVQHPNHWPQLMTALNAHFDTLKWVNIDESDKTLIKALQSIDWKILVEQFEMTGMI